MGIRGSLSTKQEAENLAKDNDMKIVCVGGINSELRDASGTVVASDITVRLWHRVIELFKTKK